MPPKKHFVDFILSMSVSSAKAVRRIINRLRGGMGFGFSVVRQLYFEAHLLCGEMEMGAFIH